MQIIINIDEDVFTRLFDNGTEDYAIVNDDLFAVAKSIRNGTLLPEHQPCEDCISRVEAISAVKDLSEHYANNQREFHPHIDFVVERLEELPSVTPQPTRPKGKWINAKVGKLFPSNDYKCSECNNILDFDGLNCGRGDANFCPNCGVDMRRGDDNADGD